MKIINRKISELITPDYNPRKITADEKKALRDSLEKFSSVEPAVINMIDERKNIIIGGNQRILVAKGMGWDTYPCVEVVLTADAERELNIRLNKSGGSWDYTKLSEEFNEDDLINWGFTEYELEADRKSSFKFKGEDEENIKSKTEYPVLILADESEYQIWQIFKKQVGCKKDVDAFSELLSKVEL